MRLGVSFHVGSQNLRPLTYGAAIAEAARLAETAGTSIDIINVGGGFPALYPSHTPPPLSAYVDVIGDALASAGPFSRAEAWCEPGRALVAEGVSVIVRVELRKGDALFLNDGAFGNLFDAAHMKWVYPVRLLRPDRPAGAAMTNFRFYGPTCDSADVMPGPFLLPEDVEQGDYLEIGMLGAYGTTLSTAFNGFGDTDVAFVTDAPFPSLIPADESFDSAPTTEASVRRRRGRGAGEVAGRR